MSEATESGELPRFAHSFLGYDRYQVEEYVGRLHEWADDLEVRLEEAERQIELREEEVRAVRARQKIVEEYDDHPTDTVGAVLVTALDELNQLRENATAESGRLLEAAKDEALAVVRAAREMAEDIVSRAKAEQPQIANDDAVEHRASIENALRDLSDEMADITRRLDEMGRQLEDSLPPDSPPI